MEKVIHYKDYKQFFFYGDRQKVVYLQGQKTIFMHSFKGQKNNVGLVYKNIN